MLKRTARVAAARYQRAFETQWRAEAAACCRQARAAVARACAAQRKDSRARKQARYLPRRRFTADPLCAANGDDGACRDAASLRGGALLMALMARAAARREKRAFMIVRAQRCAECSAAE